MSMVAAAAAAAGTLGTAGFMAGAAPWGQALNNVAATAQADSLSTVGHSSTAPAAAATHTAPAFRGAHLDVIRSAATAGGTGAPASLDRAPAARLATEAIAGQAVADRAARAKGVTAAQAKAKAAAAAKAKAAAAAKAKAAAAAKAKAAAAAKAKAAAAAKAKAVAAAKAKAEAAAKPFQFYDSVTPSAIPHGKRSAVYANGAYAASAAEAAANHSMLWIDTNGSDPAANVLDVEPGDATPAGAAQWVKARLSSRPHSVAIVYTMRSQWQDVKNNVAHLPGWMQSKVRYWIADPTGVPHIVPGASATQWYWGNSYDITTAKPNLTR